MALDNDEKPHPLADGVTVTQGTTNGLFVVTIVDPQLISPSSMTNWRTDLGATIQELTEPSGGSTVSYSVDMRPDPDRPVADDENTALLQRLIAVTSANLIRVPPVGYTVVNANTSSFTIVCRFTWGSGDSQAALSEIGRVIPGLSGRHSYNDVLRCTVTFAANPPTIVAVSMQVNTHDWTTRQEMCESAFEELISLAHKEIDAIHAKHYVPK